MGALRALFSGAARGNPRAADPACVVTIGVNGSDGGLRHLDAAPRRRGELGKASRISGRFGVRTIVVLP